MNIKKQLLNDINMSRNGQLITIPFTMEKMGKIIFLGRNLYHLIGGAGGSGKSAWVDFNYILGPYLWYEKYKREGGNNIRLKIILRSLERASKHRVAKWVALRIAVKHKILLDVPSILGWGLSKSRLPDDVYSLICESLDYFEEMMDVLEIVDGVETPTNIYQHYVNRALDRGVLYCYQEYDGKSFLTRMKSFNRYERVDPGACPQCTPDQPVYVDNDPKCVNIAVIDHFQAMSGEKDLSDKQVFDKMSRYMREMRDVFNYMVVGVSQLNRGVAETFRRVQMELLPEDKDFAGSSNMYNDCDMGGILFNPYKYNLDNVVGYSVRNMISETGINRFRTLHILKNTYGPENQILGLKFIGEVGSFTELPIPNLMSHEDYLAVRDPQYKLKITSENK